MTLAAIRQVCLTVSCCSALQPVFFVAGIPHVIPQVALKIFSVCVVATGGVDLDMGTDRDLDPASQPMSQATSGDMMGQDEDMQSGLLASWVIV